MVSQIPVATGE